MDLHGSATGVSEPLAQYQAHGADRAGRLTFPTSEGIRFVPLDDIIHLRADGSYTHLHCDGGVHILICKGLRDMERQLPQGLFVRCHHGHVINLQKVVELNRTDGYHAKMVTGERIEISRRRWHLVCEAMMGAA